MTIRTETFLLHRAICDDCSTIEASPDAGTLQRWVEDHKILHDTWIAQAQYVTSTNLFDIDAQGMPWYGHIGTAEEAAREAGKDYIVWNAMVYRTHPAVDLSDAVCRVKDLPSRVTS